MLSTDSLLPTSGFAVNPYSSPIVIQPILPREMPENPWGLAQRSGLYLLTGCVLYTAFCSPLNLVIGNLFTHELWVGTSPAAPLAVLASSLTAGLILDPLLRMKIPTYIVGPAYMLLNSILFVLFLGIIGNWNRPNAIDHVQSLAQWSLLLGPMGCLLTIHLVAPICIGAIYLAGRLVDAPAERNGKER